jgi:hypothetical protein
VASLNWNASPEPDVVGYRVYYGTAAGTYLQARGQGIDVGEATTVTLRTGLNNGQRYYFTVTAYDRAGNESPYAAEAVKLMP